MTDAIDLKLLNLSQLINVDSEQGKEVFVALRELKEEWANRKRAHISIARDDLPPKDDVIEWLDWPECCKFDDPDMVEQVMEVVANKMKEG